AHALAAGKYAQQAALVLGEVVAEQAIFLEAGLAEVIVVQHRVLDARGRNVRDEGLLPDALGNPHSSYAGLKEIFQVSPVGSDLAHPVAGGNHGQDRLGESPAEDFDLAARDEAAQTIDVLGSLGRQPFEERAAGVQTDGDFRVLLDQIEEGSVSVAVGILENVAKVADRLMIVQGEYEAKRHGLVLSREERRSDARFFKGFS